MSTTVKAIATASSGTEEIAAVLDDLHAACHDIVLSIVVTQDGFTLATKGRIEAADGERVGALSSGLLDLCRKTARELHHGEMEQVLLRGNEGYLLLRLAGPRAMLSVISRPDANIGMVLLDSERAAESVAGLV